jgi:hypothetical protein
VATETQHEWSVRLEAAARRLAVALAAAAVVLGAAALGVPALQVQALPRRGQHQGAAAAALAAPGLPWALGPRRVGIQAGHWRTEELPEELHRLRGSSGARYGEFREVDLNLEVARRTAAILRRAGIEVDLLAATVPAGYRADAFVAVHADGAARPTARGWKVAAPWRSSRASRLLADALAGVYPSFTGLPEDRYGTTFNMRGYYAFSPHRFRHAVSTDTPAAIIETGFITVAEDRELLFGDPEAAARGLAAGIIRFLGTHVSFDREALAVVSYPARRVAEESVALRFHPGNVEKSSAELPAGTLVRPLQIRDGWVEVVVWGDYRRFGWLPESSLEPLPGG